ncbi:unnamed protein product [Paramecium octaurelia]|uniref:Protein kinase domain-containing protein n=1 Tax=Paramecium octaurelia TaxID=43137 RepID=A0A8S1U972_PAROT|nr:unnamed protein product [Paramecium octaurelia]
MQFKIVIIFSWFQIICKRRTKISYRQNEKIFKRSTKYEFVRIQRFFKACIFLGLEFMHSKNSLHRDIKPENLVLDKNGYARITDLRIARKFKALQLIGYVRNAWIYGHDHYIYPQPLKQCVDRTLLLLYITLLLELLDMNIQTLYWSFKKIDQKSNFSQISSKKRSEIFDIMNMNFSTIICHQSQQILQIGYHLQYIQKLIQPNLQIDKNLMVLLNYDSIPGLRIFHQNEDNFDARYISMEDDENNELIQQRSMMLRRNSIQSQYFWIQNRQFQ